MQTKTLGFILIAVGILMLAYSGFNFKTTEKVVDLGPLEINKEKNHNVSWPPIIGVVLLVGGVVVIATNKNKRS